MTRKESPPTPNPHESTVFAAELGEAVSVDLHGLDTIEAKERLEEFLNHEFMHGTEVVKIIHGRGEQKLQRMVQNHLHNHPLVEYSRGSQSPTQQGAVSYAVLSKKS